MAGRRVETIAVGHGYDPARHNGAAKPPVYMSSTFVYRDAAHARSAHEGYAAGRAPDAGDAEGYIYARLDHPNLQMLQARMAALDGAEACAAFGSGMAAVATALLSLVRPGDSVLHTSPLYGGTDGLLTGVMAPELGVRPVAIADALDEGSVREAAAAALARGPLAAVWIETPSNPLAGLADIALIARVAREAAAGQARPPVVIVDNTFLGPTLQAPLRHGADLCMTSLTKYAGGHSDLLGGAISGATALVEPLRKRRTLMGTHLDPHGSWLLLRSIETMGLRVERAGQNAATVARFLAAHPKVSRVTWAGFADPASPAGALLRRQCDGAGPTFAFDVAGGEASCFRLLDALRVFRLAVSLGGTESLICHPATTTHFSVPPERRAAAGVTDGTIRISVGIEHEADLIEDLAQALEKA
ncbi:MULTISPECIES: cystathionine gamma-synthase family protein [Acidiphilium]|uniref:Putative methionine gamma-lyase n=2 Tax=Acidiphilium TaxID=522 RepID=F0J0X5_ACIMA|nr:MULTISPECIES: cystathionine gamma-synthase family protein [Acidiphilium]BAJ81661.1 putative methionine gamma-lyase [Acidiphilium multivorum AIU301]GAN74223.1 O-succinylhomoserine sulfhydrylase [Acidiphilium multivorum AIU301]